MDIIDTLILVILSLPTSVLILYIVSGVILKIKEKRNDNEKDF